MKKEEKKLNQDHLFKILVRIIHKKNKVSFKFTQFTRILSIQKSIKEKELLLSETGHLKL